ncbi:MAG: hypothetical protein ACRD8A_08775 [Candidatus Acidiferrales bacterium]
MFGIDPKQVSWMVATIRWTVAAIQAVAAKLGVELPAPPPNP